MLKEKMTVWGKKNIQVLVVNEGGGQKVIRRNPLPFTLVLSCGGRVGGK